MLANRLAHDTWRTYDSVLRTHLLPILGELPVDQITARHVQALKRRGLKASSTNLLLNNLKTILRQAHAWGVIDTVPKISNVAAGKRHPEFYDFDVYERLVASASTLDDTTLAIVRIGGDAGLRRGELRGLRWQNVHLEREALFVCENLTQAGHVRLPKGRRTRWVPISDPLVELLSPMKQRDEHVLSRDNGAPLSATGLRRRLAKAQRYAGLPVTGPHILRHTFCSHLAMRGTAQKVIQELAGHASSATTELYMHLAPRALKEAIKQLR